MTQVGRNRFVCQLDGTWEGGCGMGCGNSVASNALYTISTALGLPDTTFANADAECLRVAGGRLAALRRRADVIFAQLAAETTSANPFWIGAAFNASSASWQFLDGSTFEPGSTMYSPCPSGVLCPWSAAQPNLGPDGDRTCAQMGASDQAATGGWQATPCDAVRPYICRTALPGRYEGPYCVEPSRRRRRLRRRRGEEDSQSPAPYSNVGWGQVATAMAPSTDAAGDFLDEDPGPLVLVADSTPPLFFRCPRGPIVAQAQPGSSVASASWIEPVALDNVGLERVTQSHQPGDNFTVAGSPHLVEYRATDTSQLVSRCRFFVVVEFDEVQVRGEPLAIGNSQLVARTVSSTASPTGLYTTLLSEDAIVCQNNSHLRGSVMLSPAALGSWNTTNAVRFTVVPRGGDVFGVQFRQLPSARGRFLIDLHFVAPASAKVGEEARRITGFPRVAMLLENLRGLDDGLPRVLPADFFRTDTALTAVGLDSDGRVTSFHLAGATDSFDIQITFSAIALRLAYVGVPTLGDAPLRLTDDSSVRLETYITVPSGVLAGSSFLALNGGHFGVVDTVPPSFNNTCPQNVVAAAEAGRADARVAWVAPVAFDARGLASLTATASPGDRFAVVMPGGAPHVVTYTAVDTFGLIAQCSFTVTVEDREAPVLTCAPAVRVEVSEDSTVTLAAGQLAPVALSDNVDEAASLSVSLPALEWAIGSHLATVAAADSSGNVGTCQLRVDVVDVGVPRPVACPEGGYSLPSVQGETVSVTWTVPFQDNDPRPLVRSASHASGSEFSEGVTAVELRATDAANLTGVCAFSITVLNLAKLGAGGPAASDSGDALSTPAVAGIAAAGAVILFLLLVLLVLYRRGRAKPHNFRRLLEQMRAKGYDGTLASLQGEGPMLPRELKRGLVKIVSPLGKGNFGDVSKALLHEPGRPEYIVAVKRLLEDVEPTARKELLQEAALMAQFSHAHVVGLVGVVTVGEPLLVVIEFCEHGSLSSFLQSRAVPHYGKLSISRDCADGLGYLNEHGFVHRDVAARNVLVSSELKAKISDFGLSRDTHDDNYYVSSGGILPVRWCAIESLEQRKFSTATDIWGFGVLLYEMWTDGEVPYRGWSNQKVWTKVTSGYRLPCPLGCDAAIHAMMLRCWDADPAQRPSFAVLRIFFQKKLLELAPPDDAGSSIMQLATDDAWHSASAGWHTGSTVASWNTSSSGLGRRASARDSWDPAMFNSGSSFARSASSRGRASPPGSGARRSLRRNASLEADLPEGEYVDRGNPAPITPRISTSLYPADGAREGSAADEGAGGEGGAAGRLGYRSRPSFRAQQHEQEGRGGQQGGKGEQEDAPFGGESGYLDLGKAKEIDMMSPPSPRMLTRAASASQAPSLGGPQPSQWTALGDGEPDAATRAAALSPRQGNTRGSNVSSRSSSVVPAERPSRTLSRSRPSFHGGRAPPKDESGYVDLGKMPAVVARAAEAAGTGTASPPAGAIGRKRSSTYTRGQVQQSPADRRRSYGSVRRRADSLTSGGNSSDEALPGEEPRKASRGGLRALAEARVEALVAATFAPGMDPRRINSSGSGSSCSSADAHSSSSHGRGGYHRGRDLREVVEVPSGAVGAKGSRLPPQYPATPAGDAGAGDARHAAHGLSAAVSSEGATGHVGGGSDGGAAGDGGGAREASRSDGGAAAPGADGARPLQTRDVSPAALERHLVHGVAAGGELPRLLEESPTPADPSVETATSSVV